ncbi:MAG: HAMP domain-containing protein [Elusimicrobia bacterium]|nr:HAMP domain-containing protein [Candidatus Obscuribacterium magneticum]
MYRIERDRKPLPGRRKVFFMRGFQLRYTLLVAGSLLALLLFAGFHGLFMVQTAIPPDIADPFQPLLQEATLRLFIAGFIYLAVVTLAAVFLSHRAVGPTRRIEEEIRKIAASGSTDHALKVRDGDEFEGLIDAINTLVEKVKKS